MKPLPLISCLMVTGNRPAMAMRSIACYLAQTYPRRELVIVDDGDDRLQRKVEALGRKDIIHVRLAKKKNVTLGDLRNASLAAASGEYVAQWDDDDWHSEHRLQRQFDVLDGADACFLFRVGMAWPERQIYGISHPRIWEGTMLARKTGLIKYPSLRRGEDTALVRELWAASTKTRLLDCPDLYVYVVHGKNTWPQEHFEHLFGDPGFRPLSVAAAKHVEKLLDFSASPVSGAQPSNESHALRCDSRARRSL